MTEPLDLTPYIELLALVPDGAICTIDIKILRQVVEDSLKLAEALARAEQAEAELADLRETYAIVERHKLANDAVIARVESVIEFPIQMDPQTGAMWASLCGWIRKALEGDE